LKLLAFGFVLLLPVVLLAISGAIECLLACRAYLVFAEVALRGATETAFLNEILIFLAILSKLGFLLYSDEVFKPLLWSVVVP